MRLQKCSEYGTCLAPGFSTIKKSSALSAGSCPAVSHRHVAVSSGSAACISVKTHNPSGASAEDMLLSNRCPVLPLLDIRQRH